MPYDHEVYGMMFWILNKTYVGWFDPRSRKHFVKIYKIDVQPPSS